MTGLAEPIQIAKFWKSVRSHNEHVRVGIGEHKGHVLINIRVWQTGTDGIDRPTHKGIALAVGKLPELHKAITKAMEKARELGLLDHGTTSPATEEAGQ
jgi:dihydroxyacetone kinase